MSRCDARKIREAKNHSKDSAIGACETIELSDNINL